MLCEPSCIAHVSTITAGCVQGLLERCAQCTAGAGALITGASPRKVRVAALPVSAEAHRMAPL